MDALLAVYGSSDSDSGSADDGSASPCSKSPPGAPPKVTSKNNGDNTKPFSSRAHLSKKRRIEDATAAAAPTAIALPSAAELLGEVGPSSLPAPLTAPPAPSHDGRVRAFPHVEGNYATAVYIPLLPDAELQVFISAALAALRAHVPGLRPTLESPTVDATAVHNSAPQASAAGAAMAPPTVFGAAAAAAAGALPVGPLAGRSLDGKAGAAGVAAPPAVPHHISLSRTAAVRMPQIESLVESLQRAGRRFAPLELTLSGLKVFINDERTRTFLALPVAPPGAQAVNKMIAAVDRAFVMHGLPRFYEDPQPHVSIGWVAGDQQAALERAVAASISTAQLRGRRLADFTFKLRPREVLCRVGQRVNVIWSAGGAAGAAGTR